MANGSGTFYRRAGLGLLNTLARFGNYRHEVLPRQGQQSGWIDWYVNRPGAPVIVFYHGGNWRDYSKDDYRFVADTLCGFGYNVAVPDFLKYPAHRFDAILADAAAATDFLLEQVCPDVPVVTMGHSSGAQLAALLTLDTSLLRSSNRITAMIGLSGPYDFFPFTEDDHWDLFGPEDHYPRSQPVNYVRADAPELYLLHGEADSRVRRGHSKSLMEKQIAAGGRASREVYPGMGHVDAVLSFSRLHRRNSKLVHDIQSFLESRLAPALADKARHSPENITEEGK